MTLSEDIVWLFDYDLTLYTYKEKYVLDSLDKRITEYVQKTLGVDFSKASLIRQEYLLKYGTTLSGLQCLHNVLPDDFFDFIHESEFLIYPSYSKEKFSLLENLPGKKFVFTNGRADWCKAGLLSMGIDSCFSGIFDLKAMDWIGKPNVSAYTKMERFLEQFGLKLFPKKIIFLDDAKRNFLEAKNRGWTTILVHKEKQTETDFHVETIFELSALWDTLKEHLNV